MDIWNELDRLVDLPEFIEHCRKCCNSFRKRLEECRKLKGDMTDY
jgi:hypothetical protein